MTKWPAHIAERAAIFELTGADGEPLKGPTRLPIIIEYDQFIAFDPRDFQVVEVGRVGVEQTTNGVSS